MRKVMVVTNLETFFKLCLKILVSEWTWDRLVISLLHHSSGRLWCSGGKFTSHTEDQTLRRQLEKGARITSKDMDRKEVIPLQFFSHQISSSIRWTLLKELSYLGSGASGSLVAILQRTCRVEVGCPLRPQAPFSRTSFVYLCPNGPSPSPGPAWSLLWTHPWE